MPTRMIKDKVNYKTKNCLDCNKEIEWWNAWGINLPESPQMSSGFIVDEAIKKAIYPLCRTCYRKREGIEEY